MPEEGQAIVAGRLVPWLRLGPPEALVNARRCLVSLTDVALCVPLAPRRPYKLGDIRPGPRLTSFIHKSAKSRTWETRMAARAWTVSAAKVRITRVGSRRKAMIIVRGAKIGTGFTASDPGPRGGVSLPVWIWITTKRERSPFNVATIMAHEFGHALGLAHTKGCALMNPASTPPRRATRSGSTASCRRRERAGASASRPGAMPGTRRALSRRPRAAHVTLAGLPRTA
jgi:hypothetical protein